MPPTPKTVETKEPASSVYFSIRRFVSATLAVLLHRLLYGILRMLTMYVSLNLNNHKKFYL